MKINIFWFRRDLRLEDNTALSHALQGNIPVLPIFIFDKNILEDLPPNDARLNFIVEQLNSLNNKLGGFQSGIKCFHDKPDIAINQLLEEYDIATVFANKDYEPSAISRDKEICSLLKDHGVEFKLFKDQVIFEESEVVKADGGPYTVYTPYMRRWRERLERDAWKFVELKVEPNYLKSSSNIPQLNELGFQKSEINVRPFSLAEIDTYEDTRNIPSLKGTSSIGPHLRFGTVSIRKILSQAFKRSNTFVNELIWREFFMQVLYNSPHVIDRSFKSKYDKIVWRNNEEEFNRWCEGTTGYPIVDAGMRELNATGYMHNRVRMITASFLCKHLLIDWRWGEAYFAEKLLDYELASNNGNWQWVAGTGCDAAPYFRVFNPWEQQKKFDPEFIYIKQWVTNLNESDYPEPMVDHPFARKRALECYASGLN